MQFERVGGTHGLLARLVYLTECLHVAHVDVIAFQMSIERLVLSIGKK